MHATLGGRARDPPSPSVGPVQLQPLTRRSTVPESLPSRQALRLMRVLLFLILFLMAAAIGYSAWIAIRNWTHIGV